MCTAPISLDKTYVPLNPINWAMSQHQERRLPPFHGSILGANMLKPKGHLDPHSTMDINGTGSLQNGETAKFNQIQGRVPNITVCHLLSRNHFRLSCLQSSYIVCRAGKVWESRICQVPIL